MTLSARSTRSDTYRHARRREGPLTFDVTSNGLDSSESYGEGINERPWTPSLVARAHALTVTTDNIELYFDQWIELRARRQVTNASSTRVKFEHVRATTTSLRCDSVITFDVISNSYSLTL